MITMVFSKKEEFNLEHVYNSIELFTPMYNTIINKKNFYAKGGENNNNDDNDGDNNLISSESFLFLYIY